MSLPFFLFMDTVGDGSGSISQAVNGSVTPVTFKLTAEQGLYYRVNRIIVSIRDNAAVAAEKYGGLTALTNGILLSYECVRGDIDLLGGESIKANVDWGRYCYDCEPRDFGTGDTFVQARWTFGNSGSPLVLHAGESLTCTIRDDLTGLVSHTIMCQGVAVEEADPPSPLPARIYGS